MDGQKMLQIFEKSYDEQVENLKLKISYAEDSIEAWISALGKVLDTLLQYLSSAGQHQLLTTGISLRDNLIQRYLWQETFLESLVYYHVTLQRRLQFAEVLQANTKIVKRHYYSNCIHYIPEKSKYDIVLSLQIKLNLISAMKNRMEIFECKVLRRLMNTSTNSSKKNLKRSLEGLLLMTNKQNKELEAELNKCFKKTEERELKILAMEEGYFTAAAKKLNSEQWQSQADIEKKVTLLRVEPTKRRKMDIICGSCLKKRKRCVPSITQFTVDEESFKNQVSNFFKAEVQN